MASQKAEPVHATTTCVNTNLEHNLLKYPIYCIIKLFFFPVWFQLDQLSPQSRQGFCVGSYVCTQRWKSFKHTAKWSQLKKTLNPFTCMWHSAYTEIPLCLAAQGLCSDWWRPSEHTWHSTNASYMRLIPRVNTKATAQEVRHLSNKWNALFEGVLYSLNLRDISEIRACSLIQAQDYTLLYSVTVRVLVHTFTHIVCNPPALSWIKLYSRCSELRQNALAPS